MFYGSKDRNDMTCQSGESINMHRGSFNCWLFYRIEGGKDMQYKSDLKLLPVFLFYELPLYNISCMFVTKD